mgnify:CR=1 FL=1
MFKGLIVGLVAFFVVGVFHPLVVFVEYRFGKQAWWVMVLLALICLAVSLVSSEFLSLLLGIMAAGLLWGTLELFWQHKRACLGRAKRNPARSPEYYSLKDRPR